MNYEDGLNTEELALAESRSKALKEIEEDLKISAHTTKAQGKGAIQNRIKEIENSIRFVLGLEVEALNASEVLETKVEYYHNLQESLEQKKTELEALLQ